MANKIVPGLGRSLRPFLKEVQKTPIRRSPESLSAVERLMARGLSKSQAKAIGKEIDRLDRKIADLQDEIRRIDGRHRSLFLMKRR